MLYKCETCIYSTVNQKDYNKHCKTLKHKNKVQESTVVQKSAPIKICSDDFCTPTLKIPIVKKSDELPDKNDGLLFECEYCDASYNQKCSLYRHKKTCKNKINNQKEIKLEKELETIQLKHMLELKEKDLEMSQLKIQILEKHNTFMLQ
jgi:hypothetical protein